VVFLQQRLEERVAAEGDPERIDPDQGNGRVAGGIERSLRGEWLTSVAGNPRNQSSAIVYSGNVVPSPPGPHRFSLHRRPKMAAKYLIARRVKERAKALKVRISPAAIDIVDGRIQDMLKAAERAKENKRKTIMPHDI
jgi:hypothetical protein